MAHVGIMSHEDPDSTVWGTSTKVVLIGGGLYWRHRVGRECLLMKRAAVTGSAHPQVHVCWEVGNQPRPAFPCGLFLGPMGRSSGKNSDPVRGRSVAN